VIAGRTVAVVGCGSSPKGRGLGAEIDAHDVVIRCNRSFRTAGLEADYGTRCDLLVVGNRFFIDPIIPRGFPAKVVHVQDDWQTLGNIWPHRRKPLAGTYAAIHACMAGAASVTLYGIDLYRDDNGKKSTGRMRAVFKGHYNGLPSRGYLDVTLDEQAILAIPCPVTWRLRLS